MSVEVPGSSPGQALVAELRGELAGVERQIREHRFLDALEQGRVPRERLVAFAAEQRAIIASDRRSFALLAARFPQPPAGELFLGLSEGEGRALALLAPLAAALGAADAELAAYRHAPGAQAYPAFLAWLALNGSRADASLALRANLLAWGENCARMEQSLRAGYGLSEGATAFFRFFAEPAPGSRQLLEEVLDDGLAAGEDPAQARRAARLLQAYELMFWDALAEGL
jgi:thiaminase